jgi:hypothetical protein
MRIPISVYNGSSTLESNSETHTETTKHDLFNDEDTFFGPDAQVVRALDPERRLLAFSRLSSIDIVHWPSNTGISIDTPSDDLEELVSLFIELLRTLMPILVVERDYWPSICRNTSTLHQDTYIRIIFYPISLPHCWPVLCLIYSWPCETIFDYNTCLLFISPSKLQIRFPIYNFSFCFHISPLNAKS